MAGGSFTSNFQEQWSFVFYGALLFRVVSRLQALVHDILPSTTVIFSYAMGSRKLSAIERTSSFFVLFLLVLKQ